MQKEAPIVLDPPACPTRKRAFDHGSRRASPCASVRRSAGVCARRAICGPRGLFSPRRCAVFGGHGPLNTASAAPPPAGRGTRRSRLYVPHAHSWGRESRIDQAIGPGKPADAHIFSFEARPKSADFTPESAFWAHGVGRTPWGSIPRSIPVVARARWYTERFAKKPRSVLPFGGFSGGESTPLRPSSRECVFVSIGESCRKKPTS